MTKKCSCFFVKYFKKAAAAALGVSVLMPANVALAQQPRANQPAKCPSYHTVHDALVNSVKKDGKGIAVRHRGYYDKKIPENSLQGFRKTFELCIPALETDVQLTKDSVPVLFHDKSIGRMTNPDFNPETNEGKNQVLKDLTLTELRKFSLITVNGERTEQNIPTLQELFQTMIDLDAPTILFLDVKSEEVLYPTLQAVKKINDVDPGSNILKRVVLKIHLEWFPKYVDWLNYLSVNGFSFVPMTNPVVTPLAAEAIDKKPPIPYSKKTYTTNTEKSWALWSEAPDTEVPLVEVLVKDSEDFKSKERRDSPFGNYLAPLNLTEDNAVDGTMAKMVTISKSRNKPLGIFVPIPDWMMWRDGAVSGFTLRNVRTGFTDVAVDDAFSSADGQCCYQLKDLLQQKPQAHEKADIRDNLAWTIDLGIRAFTADDTDSIDTYLDRRNLLNKQVRPNYSSAPDAMNSRLSMTIDGGRPLGYSDIQLKGWNGASSGAWGGQVCVWSNNSYDAWAASCANYVTSSYTPIMRISISTQDRSKMVIQDTRSFQCLTSAQTSERVIWSNDCSSPRAQWSRTPYNQFLDYRGKALTFSWQNLYSHGLPYAWLYTDFPKTSWSQWNFRK